MSRKTGSITGSTLVVCFALAVVALALSGVVVADVLDEGGTGTGDGPKLADWDPQFVNSDTVDRYQVTINTSGVNGEEILIRQRPNVISNVTQRINMNPNFGPAMNPEIVAFKGDGGPLGDESGPERIQKNVFIDSGDVVIELIDPSNGAQSQAKLREITVEFDALSPSTPGLYNFTVDMEGQTLGGNVQTFSTTSSTGIAQVEVVDATSADPGELQVGNLETVSSAPQDEKQLEVTGTIDNTNTTANLTADVVYGLDENTDPAFAGGDLLGQTAPNVAVPAGGTANVTFFVDLTEEDEPINTGDDIRHGVDVLGNNVTQPLTITDGPIDHSEDGGATLNRTTGLIQTAVDISDDGTEDVVTVNPRGSPYNENVTVPVDNIVIQGNTSIGKPIVSWVGPQAPIFSPDPPFTVESSAENTTIRDLRIDPLLPDAGGVDVLGGSNHNVLNNDVTGTNTGAPGIGVNVEEVTGANVSSNEIANKSDGIRFNRVSNGVVDSNLVRRNLRGMRFEGGSVGVTDTNVTGNTVRDNAQGGIQVAGTGTTNNTFANNDIRDNGGGIISADGIFMLSGPSDNNITDNNVTNNTGTGIELASNVGTNNTIEANNATDNRIGIQVSADGNAVIDNEAFGNSFQGIRLIGSSNVEVVGNTANRNDRIGIALSDALNNNLTDNTANGNTQGINLANSPAFPDASDNNNLTNNTVNDNIAYGIWIEGGNNNTLMKNTAEMNGGRGIYLGGGLGSSVEADGNTLVDNTVSSHGDPGDSGIYLSNADDNTLVNNTARDNFFGIWLVQSVRNNLTDNLAENNPKAGIYLGGSANPANDNTLVNNTARGSEYGIWVRDSENNAISESLAENNQVGIEFEDTVFGFSSLEESGNTFTNDTSQNNTDWDFVIETSGGSITPASVNPADLPVTNLNIGASTNPDTTLSFDGKDVEVRSNSTPPALPPNNVLLDVGRYFEAQNTTSNAFLNMTASYNDTDVPSNESKLGLYRYDETNGLWGLLPSDVDTTNNTVSAEVVDFSTFGILQQNRTVNFEVNITGTNSPVREGDTLTVNANVTNTGNSNGTQIVQLDINGTVLDSQSVTLGPGNSTSVTFMWQTQRGDAGNYIATVSSDDDNDTAPVEVLPGEGGVRDCTNRRDVSRGEENQQCPFDSEISRGESRRDLDRQTGRAGDDRHRDSATSRRDRSRGERRNRGGGSR